MIMVVLLAMELIDKIKFRDELELARDLQADLIPKSPPQTNEYEIAAFNRIANTVGGDIYDFVPLPDGRLAVLFGDASGHGMAAGLVMAVAHAAWRTQLDVDPSPARDHQLAESHPLPHRRSALVLLLLLLPLRTRRHVHRHRGRPSADREDRRAAKSSTASAPAPIRSA